MRSTGLVVYALCGAGFPCLMGAGCCGGCCIDPDLICSGEPGDAWYAAPPAGVINGLAGVPREQVHLVAEANIAIAESFLDVAAAVPVDLDTATGLVGQVIPAIEGTSPYLVRALAREGDSLTAASFDVRFSAGTLYIGYPTLGSCDLAVPTQRTPLVVFLPSAPQVVYVETPAAPI